MPKSVDFPDYAHLVCAQVLRSQNGFGILICGSGIGMSIAANKRKGIRCALCYNVEMAEQARQHNNCNVIALGADLIDEKCAIDIIEAFLTTPFDNRQRYIRRIEKMSID